jgi:hypothetical protein
MSLKSFTIKDKLGHILIKLILNFGQGRANKKGAKI